jgi:hypothetical protein
VAVANPLHTLSGGAAYVRELIDEDLTIPAPLATI